MTVSRAENGEGQAPYAAVVGPVGSVASGAAHRATLDRPDRQRAGSLRARTGCQTFAVRAFVNGSLFDGHHHRGRLTGAVLVEDGRIVAVDAARDDLPSGAEVVDLDGGLLAPGFVDAHVHAVQGGLERIRCDLSEDRTREDYLRRISAYAASHPDLPWILGGGWSMAAFENGAALAADLDAVVPDRPVYLLNRDHHGAWVNSLALRMAGITDTSPDPAHGHFERDEQGRPSGTLHEGAMDVVYGLDPAHHRRGVLPRPARGPVLPALPRASPAGRTPSSGPTAASTTPGRRTPRPRATAT